MVGSARCSYTTSKSLHPKKCASVSKDELHSHFESTRQLGYSVVIGHTISVNQLFVFKGTSKSILSFLYCHVVSLFVEKELYPKTDDKGALVTILRERKSMADEVGRQFWSHDEKQRVQISIVYSAMDIIPRIEPDPSSKAATVIVGMRCTLGEA